MNIWIIVLFLCYSYSTFVVFHNNLLYFFNVDFRSPLNVVLAYSVYFPHICVGLLVRESCHFVLQTHVDTLSLFSLNFLFDRSLYVVTTRKLHDAFFQWAAPVLLKLLCPQLQLLPRAQSIHRRNYFDNYSWKKQLLQQAPQQRP